MKLLCPVDEINYYNVRQDVRGHSWRRMYLSTCVIILSYLVYFDQRGLTFKLQRGSWFWIQYRAGGGMWVNCSFNTSLLKIQVVLWSEKNSKKIKSLVASVKTEALCRLPKSLFWARANCFLSTGSGLRNIFVEYLVTRVLSSACHRWWKANTFTQVLYLHTFFMYFNFT